MTTKDIARPLTLATRWAVPSGSSNNKNSRTRLVTPHPLFPETACIETTWNDKGIYIYSGPDSSPRVLHASLEVGPCEMVVWTVFGDDDNDDNNSKSNKATSTPPHPVLCALVHATQVCIWDVYPNNADNNTDDSSLPAEGWAVSLPFECSRILAIPPRGLLLQRLDAEDDDDDDDGFILKSPPSSSIPSLFSLSHPLQDVLPVCQIPPTTTSASNHQHPAQEFLSLTTHSPPMTDIYEKWIWMGAVHFPNDNNNNNSNTDDTVLLVVSYHTLQQRHRVWALRDAPPPPRPVKLYEQTRLHQGHSSSLLNHNNLNTTTGTNSTTLAVWEEDLFWNAGAAPTTTRQEALASALGLRRTPRKTDLGSPRGSQQPFAPLHAALALELLYSSAPQGPADRLFLVSNPPGTAQSILCLLAPQGAGQVLQFWSIIRHSNKGGNVVQVVPQTKFPCKGAVPSQTSDTTTEVLVHKNNGQLVFSRAWLPIADCTVNFDMVGLEDSFRDQLTVRLSSSSAVRCQLPLRVGTDHLTETVLQTVEQTLEWLASDHDDSHDNNDNDWQHHILGLKLRADTCRLSDSVSAWSALCQVLLAVCETEWYGAARLVRPAAAPTTAWEALSQATTSSATTTAMIQEPTFFYAVQHLQAAHWRRRNVIVPALMDHLHLLHEDLRLSKFQSADRARLAALIVQLCRAFPNHPQDVNVTRFLQYYRAAPPAPSTTTTTAYTGAFSNLLPDEAVPSLYEWLRRLLSGETTAPFGMTFYRSFAPFAKINSLTNMLRALLSVDAQRDEHVVQTLLQEGYTNVRALHDGFPTAILIPILEVLSSSRDTSQRSMDTIRHRSPLAWSLIGRNDLSLNLSSSSSLQQPSAWQQAHAVVRSHQIDEKTFADVDYDGLMPLQLTSALLFPTDNRMHEATKLLRSSRPLLLRVDRAVEVSDHDYERLKQKRLLSLSFRTLALPVGRGMITIGNLEPIPAEPLPVPEICLKGKVPPSNAGVTLDSTECPTDMRVWPEFHNGVAAGLRLPRKGHPSASHLSRTWIIYNKPRPYQEQSADGNNEPNTDLLYKNHSHGGVLFALGLRGHLTALEMSDLYEYLTRGTVTTTVGILLGLAANKRGSCDMAVSKMLCLHIPSLIPQHFSAIDVAGTVQAAAVLGAGLLFQRSSHRMMTEFLLNEIGKRPDSDASAFDRESYNLACGIALGMVNLCLVDDHDKKSGEIDRAAGLADLHMEERLHKYVVGGIDNEEKERTREANDRFSMPTTAASGDNEKCSTIYEGDLINTEVTAPGSILALGLMFMKSGNQAIASTLALPNTHFLLEFVRPDLLALRLVARSLVLWDKVVPSIEWIESQVPSVAFDAYSKMGAVAKRAMDGMAPSVGKEEMDFDRRAVRQIYVYTVAGACFGMGLRFAGTGNEAAQKAIEYFVLELYALRESNDPVAVASRPELSILETALGCTAIALAMIMAGTGDLKCLKIFKMLRWRCDETPRHGFHMITGMAVGLLFLGGGTCTLGRDPEDIAVLLTAFFPRFPSSTSDNQCHLQPLRHLYALAVKESDLRAVDVDTQADVSVDLEIISSSSVERITLPALLRNSDHQRREVRLVSDEYFPLRLNFEDVLRRRVIFVKRKNSLPSLRRPLGAAPLAETKINIPLDRILLNRSGTADDILITLLEESVSLNSDMSIQSILPFCRGNSTNPDYLDSLKLLQCYLRHRGKWGIKGSLFSDILLSYILESKSLTLNNN